MKNMHDARNLSRREMLRIAGATMATALVGCSSDTPETANVVRTSAPAPSCVVRPEQTEGPYFVDTMLRRSDIRTDPTDGSISAGVPLRLTFNVSRVDGDACAPVAGAIVDVWQCDAVGVYSGVRDMSGYFDTRERKFLRGYQETDDGGAAEFMTIYPGWYRGRTVHIHFKIRTDPDSDHGREFISQLYFDDDVTAGVHTREPYAQHGPPPEKNQADGIFRRGGDRLLPDLSGDGDGYAANFSIGLEMS